LIDSNLNLSLQKSEDPKISHADEKKFSSA